MFQTCDYERKYTMKLVNSLKNKTSFIFVDDEELDKITNNSVDRYKNFNAFAAALEENICKATYDVAIKIGNVWTKISHSNRKYRISRKNMKSITCNSADVFNCFCDLNMDVLKLYEQYN